MKKSLKILGIIFFSLLATIILAWAIYKIYIFVYPRAYVYTLKKPYLADAKVSLGAETPLEAYKNFRADLAAGEIDKALQYIFLSSRDKYRQEFKDPERIKVYLNMPEELKEQSRSKCTGEAFACEETAIYFYEYEITQPEKHEYNGKEFILKPGKFNHYINFTKNLKGKWQIESL